VGLDPQQTGRVREHRSRIRLRKPLAGEHFEKDLCVLPGQISVGLSLRRDVAEVAEAVNHLLGRSAADAELETTTGNEVGGAGVLGHVERVLITHVDNGGTDLDPTRSSADRGQQRKRRGELAGEVMHPEVRPIGTDLLRRHGQLDRLQQRIRGRLHERMLGRRPVAEREKPDLLHIPGNIATPKGIPPREGSGDRRRA
jgi:hypothetical protein